MVLSVADRFGFSEREIITMPLSRLRKWYDGAKLLYEREKRAIDGTTDN